MTGDDEIWLLTLLAETIRRVTQSCRWRLFQIKEVQRRIRTYSVADKRRSSKSKSSKIKIDDRQRAFKAFCV